MTDKTDREIMKIADHIEALAFKMVAPNAYTPMFVSLANEIRTAIHTRLAQPEQEPVAWQVMVENEATNQFSKKDMAHDWCVQQKLSGSPYAYWIRPLYTAPPEQESLAWLYPEGLAALKAGKCWTAYGTKQDKDNNIPIYTTPPEQEPDIPERPYEIGARLARQGHGISAIWGAVQSDSDMAEAQRGYENALAKPEQKPVTAQHRFRYPQNARFWFRHPEKTIPDWSKWQECLVSNRPAWEIDSQGYEVEYRNLYTAPQQREWQELTNEEISAISKSIPGETVLWAAKRLFAREIEAKLKEKNT